MSDQDKELVLFDITESDLDENTRLRVSIKSNVKDLEECIKNTLQKNEDSKLKIRDLRKKESELTEAMSEKILQINHEKSILKSILVEIKDRKEFVCNRIEQLFDIRNEYIESAYNFYFNGSNGRRLIEESRVSESEIIDLLTQNSECFDRLDDVLRRKIILECEYRNIGYDHEFVTKMINDEEMNCKLHNKKLERLESELESKQKILRDLYYRSLKDTD